VKILIPTLDFPPLEGGRTTLSVHLARELTKLGHDVTVIAPHSKDAAALDDAEPARIFRYKAGKWGWTDFLSFLRTAWPCTHDTDIIFAMDAAYGGILGRLARLLRGKRYVVFARANELVTFQENWFIRLLYRNVYRRAESNLVPNRYTSHKLEDFGVSFETIQRIPPGAGPVEPLPEAAVRAVRHRFFLDEEDRLILCVGRFIPRKGQVNLVIALAQVHEHAPNTHLILAGRGPSLDACLEKARAMGIDGHVHCPGYVDDATLAALYQACAVFALPAGADESGRTEDLGIVFAEAHACGKPVVAGRAGGIAETVIDNETGLLVPPDDPPALADAITKLLLNPPLAKRLGENGRRRIVEERNWTVFTQKLMENTRQVAPPSQ
jgi:phosphatidylinositol alpha-1,6-mannosyltransferase